MTAHTKHFDPAIETYFIERESVRPGKKIFLNSWGYAGPANKKSQPSHQDFKLAICACNKTALIELQAKIPYNIKDIKIRSYIDTYELDTFHNQFAFFIKTNVYLLTSDVELLYKLATIDDKHQ